MLYPIDKAASPRRRVLGLWVLLAIVLSAALPAVGQATDTKAADGSAPPASQLVRAYELVEPWVRGLAVPDSAEAEAVGGACVTLRLRGSVIGRGRAIGLGEATLPEAARLALEDAAAEWPVINTANAEESRRLVAQEVVITLELAGDAIPLNAATYTELTAVVSPGTEAVAVRIGNAGAAAFPIEMMVTSQQTGSAASRLVGQLTGDAMLGLRQPAELPEAGFFRLKTVAGAQLIPGGPFTLLHRGGRVVRVGEVTSGALRRSAEELTAFLIRHPGVGVYQPINNLVAEPGSAAGQALAAYAVARASRSLSMQPMPGSPSLSQWVTHELGVLAGIEERDVAVVSLRAMTHRMVGDDAATRKLIDDLEDRILAGERAGRPSSAIAAWALAHLGRRDSAGALLQELRQVEHAGQLVGVMPWFGWAERALAGGEHDLPSAVSMRQMREVVRGFQLRSSDAGYENRDLVGGVVFTTGPVPLPTWQSVRPIAFQATMLGDPRLTEPGEITDETVALLASLRYLLQLSASETEQHMYRRPENAMGGVRAAVWDQSMPIEASALTLLALLESLESIAAINDMPADESAGE